MKEFLRNVSIFQNMEDSDIDRLVDFVAPLDIKAGETLFLEGDIGSSAYIIEKGAIEILKDADGELVLLAVVGPGEVIGEMALLDEAPRMASAKAREDSLLFLISQEQLDELMNSSASATRSLLSTVTTRWRETEGLLLQNEKMVQLGTLTAGMAHELNNPAAAIQRGSSQIKDTFQRYLESHRSLFKSEPGSLPVDHMRSLEEVAQSAIDHQALPDAMALSDIEYAIESWLEAKGVNNAWEIAPGLARMGLGEKELADLGGITPKEHIGELFQWASAIYNLKELINQTGQAAEHISKIVLGLKTYAYQESGPMQDLDLNETIENALSAIGAISGGDIAIKKEYDRDIPLLKGYANELVQVWVNLIKNAIDAIDEKGEITIRSSMDRDAAVVEIIDTGSGIPAEIQDKVFDPFFTTKPPGKGAGLGLTISYNIVAQKHHGDIHFTSRPGETKFSVTLPIQTGAESPSTQLSAQLLPVSDADIIQILDEMKDIAVVGASARADRAGHTVPAYLIDHGYHIIPVNPHEEQLFGLSTYPDLLSIPGNFDVVQIFRRSEDVPPIVDQAIEKGAKVIWMQEGVVHPAAALKAQEAGLKVVMDACMRKMHIRFRK